MPFASVSLYVGDLHPEVAEEELLNTFKEAGNVLSLKICRDHATKKSLGYAYINFSTPQEAERALEAFNYKELHGKQMRIMWSQRDPSARKSGKGNIFIKNLDASIDNKALYDTFSTFGNILSCKVVPKVQKKVVTTEDGKTEERTETTGYGFVHFESAESASQAIEKVNNKLLNGKKVFVGPFQKKEQRLNIKASDKEYTNIYVKHLDKSVTDEQLAAVFSRFGNIQHAEVKRDETGASKGFGFVNYDKAEAAIQAVDAMNGQDFMGTKLYVGRHQSKNERQSILRTQREKFEQEKAQKFQGVNLYVKNLDDSIDEEKLNAEFSKYGKLQNAKIMMDPESGVKKGFGFVCFENPEDAARAIQDMNGKMVGSKPLYVALAEKKEVRQAKLRAQHSQMKTMNYYPGGFPVVYGAPMTRGAPYGQPMIRPARGGYPTANPQQRGGYQQPQVAQGAPTTGRGGSAPRGGRGGRTTAPTQQNQRGGNQQANKSVRYNQNVRNQPQQPQQPQPVKAAPQQPVQEVQPQADEVISPEKLAQLSEEDQKRVLGEQLYPLIYEKHQDLAGKITGMLLDLDNGELLHYLEDRSALDARVLEAIAVLNESQNE